MGAHAVAPCRLTPKAASRITPDRGEGLFALETIAAGETIVEWTGRVCTLAQWRRAPRRIRQNSVQIGEDAYLVPDTLAPGDHVNHCCEPNAGLRGDRTVVAMRDIAAGEEVTYDYAMSDGSAYDEFECRCGAPACRGRITGDDWRRPELQARYRGWFSPYLAERIERAQGRGGG
jgi:SET domain-containing protein